MRHSQLTSKVNDLEIRVGRLESQFGSLERRVKSDLDGMGRYKDRTSEELATVQVQLGQIVGILESVVSSAENRADAERAAALLKRARNNLTRANRAAS